MSDRGETKDGRFVGPGETKSVVVNIDRAVNGNYPVLRFPTRGHVQSAFLIADASTSGTNLVQAQLLNGGLDGAGTIITAPISHGTLVSGSAYLLTIAGLGTESYAEGELCMVKLNTSNTTTDVQVQVDYVLNAVPIADSAPVSPPQ